MQYKRAGIVLGGLTRADAVPLRLYGQRSFERWHRLNRFIDEINLRYGRDVIKLAALYENGGWQSQSIRWKDIDAASNTVLIRAGYAKTGKERRTIITSRGLEALDAIREIAPAEGPFTEIGDTKRAWNSVRERAGLLDIRFHDLRGTFATRLAAAGVSELIIMQLMGHSPTTVTRRHYIGLDSSIIADTIEKIEAWRKRHQGLPVTSNAIALSAAVN
ncbi:MAG: tyrosine-type recombinase/integrase [Acidobacteria bacterium]|nr:tyrosine-type recombinase/integrase [Acidobacteriota bacterium]